MIRFIETIKFECSNRGKLLWITTPNNVRLSDFGIIIMKLTPREESFIKNGIMTIHHVVVNKFIIIWKKFYI